MQDRKAPVSLVCVGEITAPHGVRGLVRVRSFTADPEALFAYRLQREDGTAIKLTKRGTLKDLFMAAVEGVDNIEAAQAWRGVKLYVDRADLPATKENEYYLSDLMGLATQLADGTPVGFVADIHDFGAGTILEIKRNGAPPLMLPFDDDFVPEVKIADGVIVIVLPNEIE